MRRAVNVFLVSVFAILIVLGKVAPLGAHCEIPCGIYDDHMRIHMLEEHITTMEKSIQSIQELTGKTTALDQNQLVRWIMNKEHHAEEFQKIVWQYFLTQRVKPVAPGEAGYQDYVKKIELLHQLSYYAMKVKQSVDTANTDKLRSLLSEFEKLYFGESKQK